MIAGLKTLDDGMKEPLVNPLNEAAPQKATSGSITIAKKQAEASVWNAGANAGMTLMNQGEEVVRIDPEQNISFSTKMEKAIKKVMEAPTEDMVQGTPETGKAP
jgi:hypothetical protein